MVTTRRAFHRQNGGDALQVEGPSTSSVRGRATAARGRGRSAAHGAGNVGQPQATDEGLERKDTVQTGRIGQLLKIWSRCWAVRVDPYLLPFVTVISASDTEEPHSDAPAGDKGTRIGGEDSSVGQERLEPADEVGGGDRETLSTGGSSGSASSGLEGVDDRGNNDDDGESDDVGDGDVFRSNFMGQLALSLKAALNVRAGVRKASPAAGSSHPKLGIASDPEAIRWKPETQRQNVPRPGASTRVAPGVGATKEKGLAQQLLAPPRVKPAEHAASSTSKEWFQLPAPKITDEVKQELQLLRLRGAYDPKRFYKSFDNTKLPTHFQIGTVVDNPQDFYSSRLTARQRGVSITQELLSDPALTATRKKRYSKLQKEATRFQKIKKRKTDLVRKVPKAKRPKH
ncbi:hypothetical protein VaNZ11_014426 [Volvox africanus]|uniref:Fcf2 pre-rRNA processing C-terminal domain-containing protein n=1 Tax=Volvox africanus TaxID=51714 RepID=A0ABQ5SJT3_9CHLO|nr:hypothetical protein VaNZ11_014426 [Volvox africanus]